MLRLRQSAIADAPPEAIWPFLADPQALTRWHPKLVAVERSAQGTVTAGESFLAGFEQRPFVRRLLLDPDESELTPAGPPRRPAEHKATVVTVKRVEPPLLVEYEHALQHNGLTRIATESYRLEPVENRTRITQVIDLSRAQLPWWAASLVWLIARGGRPVSGRSDLEPLIDEVAASRTSDRPAASAGVLAGRPV